MGDGHADPSGRKMKRRGAPKSRNGCYTCKMRRVKCDETKPKCNKCEATGRTCDEYQNQNSSRVGRPSFSMPCPQSMEALLATEPGDPLAKRSLYTFRTRTIVDIQGHFESPLWSRCVLQAIHADPAIWYLATAVGALHEKRDMEQVAKTYGRESLDVTYPTQQYTLGLKCLRSLLGSPDQRSIELSLIGALICIYFEALQNRLPIALKHLQDALKALVPLLLWEPRTAHEKSAEPSALRSPLYSVEEDILGAFYRLDVQAACYMSAYRPIISVSTSSLQLPARFKSINDARHALYALMSGCFDFMRSVADFYRYEKCGSVPLSAMHLCNTLTRKLDEWRITFSDLLDGFDVRQNPRCVVSAAVLLIHLNMSYVKVVTSLQMEESVFDQFDALFTETISLGESVTQNTCHSDARRPLSLDMGIQEAVFFAAIKCRNSLLRRRAVDCLQRMTWREGAWDPSVLVRVACWVIDMEEGVEAVRCGSTMSSDRARYTSQHPHIPEFARVYSIGFDIDWKTRRVRATSMRRSNGLDGEWDIDEEVI